MAKYDIEQFIREIETLFKANLNTEIGLVNTDKGDFTIDTIGTDAWYIGGLPEVFSEEFFVFIAISDIKTESISISSSETITLQVEVAIPDAGDSAIQGVLYRLLRYQRALNQVAEKHFDNISGQGIKIKVSSLIPASDIFGQTAVSFAGISVQGSFPT